jgi:hypothetical protein
MPSEALFRKVLAHDSRQVLRVTNTVCALGPLSAPSGAFVELPAQYAGRVWDMHDGGGACACGAHGRPDGWTCVPSVSASVVVCNCSCAHAQRRENAMHWLAKRSLNPVHVDRVFRLMEAVCEDRELGVAALNAQNHLGETPLHIALGCKHPKLLALLLRRGANPTLVSQVCEGGWKEH